MRPYKYSTQKMKDKIKNQFILISISILMITSLFSSPYIVKAGTGSMSRAEQEESTPQCKGPENPVGETLKIAIAFTGKLNEILTKIIYDSQVIFKASEDLDSVALGCNKKRCGQKCNAGKDGSNCCHYTTVTNPDGSTSSVCDLFCQTLACHSKCEPPPCGYGGMAQINADLQTVQSTLIEVKNLQKQYEQTLVSYIDIYKWAFGEVYQCNSTGICTDIGHGTVFSKIVRGQPVYLNNFCNGECPGQSQIKGYTCEVDQTAAGAGAPPVYKCQAVGPDFNQGKIFHDMSSCQNVCGYETYKCNSASGTCDTVKDGSGDYISSSTCQNNCIKGMAINPLNIPAIGECDPAWATTSLGNSTICDHGDSLTDVTMAANYCGKNVNPKEALEDILKKQNTVNSDGNINWNAATCPCKGYLGIGLHTSNRIKTEMADFGYTDALTFIQDHYLQNGTAVVVECDKGLGSKQQDGYFSIILRGYDPKTKTVFYNDPKTGTQSTMSSDDYYNKYRCYSDQTTGKQALIIGCLNGIRH